MKAAVFGTISFDMIFDLSALPSRGQKSVYANTFKEFHGGGAANVCAYLSGTMGIKSGLISAVGDDTVGDKLIDGIRKYNVDTMGIARYHDCSSTRIVTLKDNHGGSQHIVSHGAIDSLHAGDIDTGLLDSCCLIYIAPNKRDDIAGYLINYGTAKHKQIAFNPGPAYLANQEKLDKAVQFFQKVDYVIVNRFEASAYSGAKDLDSAIDTLLSYGIKCLVVTCEDSGAYLSTNDTRIHAAGIPISAGDTNGAGDAFSAGFIGLRLLGYDYHHSLQFANALGAYKAQHFGLREVVPSIKEVWDLAE